MVAGVLSTHEGLGTSGRLPVLAREGSRVTALELAILALAGCAAAALSAYSKGGLGLPGHNILRVIFPMAMGLALVPRHGSGTLMGLSGLGGGALLGAIGPQGIGAGAMTGLVLLGIFLDVAMLGAQSGKAIYLRFASAGLAANLVALAARGAFKAIQAQPPDAWYPKALVSYPVCGLLAGLISAAVWFRIQKRSRQRAGSEAAA